MDIKDILKLLESCDDPEDLAWDGWEGGAKFKLIESGEEYCEHKTCYTSTYLQEIATGNYYEVTSSRSNGGYWSDSERYPYEVRQVVPREVIKTIIEWDGV